MWNIPPASSLVPNFGTSTIVNCVNFIGTRGQKRHPVNKFLSKGPFKYYVIKEVGAWGQKMAIFDDLQYCKSSKRWVQWA